MERPIFKPIGTPAEELDTPSLVVDLEILQKNIEELHTFFSMREAKIRPHVESHRCPEIAHMQLACAGTVGGISVNTIGEGEVFAQTGIDDIFVVNEVVTRNKISRLCALANSAKLTIPVDNLQNIKELSEAAQKEGITLNVVVDVDTGLHRCGVQPGAPAVILGEAINRSPGLHFSGLMTYEGDRVTSQTEESEIETRIRTQKLLDTRELMENDGLEVDTVSVGGTHNFEVVGTMDGVTEIPAGSYALMDFRYHHLRPRFRQAAKVLATVTSHPEPSWAFVDAGQKSIGIDTGLPVAEERAGVRVARMSAEHGFLELNGEAQIGVDLGTKIWLTPWDSGTCVNLYDYIHVVRGGRLEMIWDVAARGRYR